MKLEKITINRKHEMFWNRQHNINTPIALRINRKHEMFWNDNDIYCYCKETIINRKHEMFWNCTAFGLLSAFSLLTVNMKCFEIAWT